MLFTAVRALVRPDPRLQPPPAPALPPTVRVDVHVPQPRPCRRIRAYSTLERDAEANKARRESIHRRYDPRRK